jgi:hypothetical protein
VARTIDPTVEISPQAANADLEVWEHHLETEVENTHEFQTPSVRL